jgi:hypothetical protein
VDHESGTRCHVRKLIEMHKSHLASDATSFRSPLANRMQLADQRPHFLESPIGDQETPRLEAAWDAARHIGDVPSLLLSGTSNLRACRATAHEAGQWVRRSRGAVNAVTLKSAARRTDQAFNRDPKPPPLGAGVFTPPTHSNRRRCYGRATHRQPDASPRAVEARYRLRERR